MDRKLWGLFTGPQITALLITAMLCVPVPGGLWASAVQYSNVSLWDPAAKVRAKILKGGAQIVSDGKGAMTVDGNVTATVSDGSGPMTVDGTVTETAPASLFRAMATVNAATCLRVIIAPADSAIVVKRLIVNTYADPTPGSNQGIGFYLGQPGACAGFLIGSANPPTFGVQTLDLGAGVAIPAGAVLWAQSVGAVAAQVYGFGYLVPASAVPAATAVTAQASGASQVR